MTTEAEKRFVSQLKITSAEYVPGSIRAECLKMAYETAHNINLFKSASAYAAVANLTTTSESSFEDDLKEVFEIADKNLDYILNKHKDKDNGAL